MTDPKFDRLLDLILEVRDQTVKNNAVLEEHMRRTEASEARLEVQEQKLEAFMQHISDDLAPIKTHVKIVSWIPKAVVALLGVAGTIFGIIEVIHKLQ